MSSKPVIGDPKEANKPEPEERQGFYIHPNLIAYLDTQPDGVYVDGKTPKGQLVFRVHKGNVAEAMDYIDRQKELFTDGESEGTEEAE